MEEESPCRRYALTLVIVCLCALPAGATVTLQTGNGYVLAVVAPPGGAVQTDQTFWPDLNPFMKSAFEVNTTSKGTISATADQSASLSLVPATMQLTGLTFSGASSATAALNAPGAATGDSYMALSFQVSQPDTFNFTGEMARGASGPSIKIIQILGSTQVPVLTIDPTTLGALAYQTTPFNVSQLLGPGTYSLQVDVFNDGSARTFATSSSLDFVLAIPEPASLALLALGGLVFARRRG